MNWCRVPSWIHQTAQTQGNNLQVIISILDHGIFRPHPISNLQPQPQLPAFRFLSKRLLRCGKLICNTSNKVRPGTSTALLIDLVAKTKRYRDNPSFDGPTSFQRYMENSLQALAETVLHCVAARTRTKTTHRVAGGFEVRYD